MQNLACARAHMQNHVEAARRHGKAFGIFLHAQEPWKCSSSSNNNLGTCSYRNCKRFRALVLVCDVRKRLVSSGLVAKRLFPILLA